MFKHVFTLLLALVLLCACAASTEQEGSESAPGVSGSASSEASVSEESFASDVGVGESAEESSAESVADSEDSVASSQPEESEEPNESSLPEESEEPVEPSQPEESEEPVEPSQPAESEEPVEPSQPEESEEPVEPSQPEESEEPNESSEEEPPETADVKYVAVNSLSEPVLMLPCHTRDNLPMDFILAMQNNPVDIDYWAEYVSWIENGENGDSPLQKYAAIWHAEVIRAAEDLGEALGENYKSELLSFYEKAIFEGHRKYDLDWKYYLNIDENIWLGTAIYYALDAGYLDVYRQITFRLKYMLYLVETADGKTADLSLQFVHTPVYDGEADELVVVAADDGFLVRTPYSPSYTGEYGTTFIEAMKNNPIDQGQTVTLEAFNAELRYALQQMKTLVSADAINYFDEYVSDMTSVIHSDASWFSVLYDLGYIDLDIRNQLEIDGYRQVLFCLKYWMFVFETEDYETEGEPNLAFTFSQ